MQAIQLSEADRAVHERLQGIFARATIAALADDVRITAGDDTVAAFILVLGLGTLLFKIFFEPFAECYHLITQLLDRSIGLLPVFLEPLWRCNFAFFDPVTGKREIVRYVRGSTAAKASFAHVFDPSVITKA
jgi:hypothetical protein